MKNYIISCVKLSSQIIIAILFSLLFLTIMYFLFKEEVYLYLIQSNTELHKLTYIEKININQLLEKKLIISYEQMQNNLIKYYDTFITILSVLIGFLTFIFGILSLTTLVSLKGKVRENINEAIEKQISNHFFESWLTEMLNKATTKYIDEKYPNLLKDQEDLISTIENRVLNQLEKDKEQKLYENEGRK